jgi:hypothetical protein
MMPVVDLSGHCKATEESGSLYTQGVHWVGHVTDEPLGHVTEESLGHVTDESLGHVTGGVEEKSCDLLPVYQWVM